VVVATCGSISGHILILFDIPLPSMKEDTSFDSILYVTSYRTKL
jgi:hypothetical protein